MFELSGDTITPINIVSNDDPIYVEDIFTSTMDETVNLFSINVVPFKDY